MGGTGAFVGLVVGGEVGTGVGGAVGGTGAWVGLVVGGEVGTGVGGGTGAGVGFGVGGFVGDGVLLLSIVITAVPGTEVISIESTVIVTVFPVPPKSEMA